MTFNNSHPLVTLLELFIFQPVAFVASIHGNLSANSLIFVQLMFTTLL